MQESLYVVACDWYAIVGIGGPIGNPDRVSVVAESEQDAIKAAEEYSRTYPLYPLATYTPTNYRVVETRSLDK